MDGKKNPVTIQVREFERRPNAGVRRVFAESKDMNPICRCITLTRLSNKGGKDI